MTETPSAKDALEESRAEAVWVQRCGVLRNAWVQVRYHRRRQRFFDLLDKLTKSCTVLLGGSLLGQELKTFLPYVASAISGLGLLSLVYGYGDRKQTHKELAEQAANLVASIEAVPARQLNEAGTALWGADYARLCAKAPPPMKTLMLICEREQSVADNHPDHIPMQNWLKRLFADFVS